MRFRLNRAGVQDTYEYTMSPSFNCAVARHASRRSAAPLRPQAPAATARQYELGSSEFCKKQVRRPTPAQQARRSVHDNAPIVCQRKAKQNKTE